jgi:hypothetical protein
MVRRNPHTYVLVPSRNKTGVHKKVKKCPKNIWIAIE